MKRARGLVELSRRDFCVFAGGLALVGCVDGGTGAIKTGPLGTGDDQPPIDSSEIHDAATPPPDAPGGAVCAAGAIDVGAPSAFSLNTPVAFTSNKMFVVRDNGGLYALTSACTHEGVACAVSSGRFRCPRHGALFTLNGAVISGPVSHPLVHYSMCTLANGHVGVIKSVTVSATTRLIA